VRAAGLRSQPSSVSWNPKIAGAGFQTRDLLSNQHQHLTYKTKNIMAIDCENMKANEVRAQLFSVAVLVGA